MKIERVTIVNIDEQTEFGCCPDLPDSVYIDEKDAERRVKEIYDNAIQFCKEKNIEIDEKYSSFEPDEGIIYGKNKDYYFKTYIVGSVPIIRDYDNDWKELQNQKPNK